MTDSNFTEFDAKLMLSSFFSLILIFGVLHGFGILQDEVGEPPSLSEKTMVMDVGDTETIHGGYVEMTLVYINDVTGDKDDGQFRLVLTTDRDTTEYIVVDEGNSTTVELDGMEIRVTVDEVIDSGDPDSVEDGTLQVTVSDPVFMLRYADFPNERGEPGNMGGNHTLQTDGSDSQQLTETWGRDWHMDVYESGNNQDGDWVEFRIAKTFGGSSTYEFSGEMHEGDNATMTFGDDGNESITVRVNNISDGEVHYTIVESTTSGSSGILDGILHIANILIWFVGTIFTIIVQVVKGVIGLLAFIFMFTWYLLAGWFAISGLMGSYTWLGYLVQGVILALVIGFFNGVAKIIKMVPTT